ncbi:group II intron maturase-specific domain-containing protein [Bacillus sp. B1-b2]|uniref:group II intron maturase-specific domain-containing protein n=1 Tax=Bacillus sp. B1-b2 TaxID=2653201 RepID=UPI001D01A1C2|nr:group II intron maturase-specific domain-containing protein [Bacillus sp. B1-b2]
MNGLKVEKTLKNKLKLKVNEEKNAVRKPKARIFLGMSFYKILGETKVYLPKTTKKRLEDKLKRLTNRNWGVSMEYRIRKINQLIQGWGNYFKIANL